MSLQTLVDRLLFEEEGNTLDFKSEQYRFSGATDNEKSELLKDIIAFANAWRRTDAYILIGVKEVKGGRSEIVGILEHLDDANLQEFINFKTQRPIDFSYKTVQHEGAQIGIIHIPVQRRPFYLQKDFGRLNKSQVYIRRGSSTAIASPDEISTMGTEINSIYRDSPILEAFLISGQHDDTLEKRIDRKLINAKIPEDEQFPDYVECSKAPDGVLFAAQGYANSDYYREYAKYQQAFCRVRGFKLGVKNSGAVPARDVRVIIEIVNEDKTSIVCKLDDLPNKPRRSEGVFIPHRHNAINKVHDVLVKNTPHGWRITSHLGKIQPKDMAITKDYFCLGAVTSKSIQINVQVFSDDLPEPKQETLEVRFDVEDRVYSVSDFLPKKKD